MPRRYSFESDPDEQEPLDNPNNQYPLANRHPQSQQRPYYDEQQQPYYDQQVQPPPQPQQQRSHIAPTGLVHGPGSHPDSSFSRLAANRRYSRDRSLSGGGLAPQPHAVTGARAATGAASVAAGIPSGSRHADPVSPISPPQPPPHGRGDEADGPYWGHDQGYPPIAVGQPPSNITPGADNFSDAAAGGVAGIAYSVAERNARESGLEAMRGPQQPPHLGYPQQAYQGQGQGQWQNHPYGRERGAPTYDQPPQELRPSRSQGGYPEDRNSHSSLQGLGAAAVPPGNGSPGMRTPSRSPHSFSNDVYTDDPYLGYSAVQDPRLGVVNPNEIEDDGDEGLEYGRTRGARTSMLSLGGHSTKSGRSGRTGGAAAGAVGGAAGGAAAAGGVLGTLGGLVGRPATNRAGSSGQYNAVHDGNTGYSGYSGYPGAGGGGGGGGGGGIGGSAYDLGGQKSEWLSKQSNNSKKWRWAIIIGVGLVIAAGIACGVVFGYVLKRKNSAAGGGSSSQSAAGDTAANGDLDINSPEIQALLNNKNLHKVFPGIDYTPVNTQYPDCLTNPPSQNNVTRDVAVLSQLTNTIRLYGTDCNQTEMTIHAINQLKMQDTVKIWMGVWQDNNGTTNARQLAQMWDIVDKYGADPFKGVIVANEILFRQQMTSYQLGQLLSSVRTNLTSKSISLPVATSDLGTEWDANLAAVSDLIMANIHPFFGGVNADDAASWTYSFWETQNSGFFKQDSSKNIISETGWPSQGGTDCGTDAITDCPNAAVAGIDQMNRFMADWVCQALANGTQYFWFEAFDEPWKIQYDTAGQAWEDHWGLMDVDRNLKSGVSIPDCGGKTV